ncbi:RNA polymerase sigma-70 factor, ECF subfamily [bacterium A37T11]|nr:RNA polymerase sigma-70 factor, ECF subfamily [bacterium A37T11]
MSIFTNWSDLELIASLKQGHEGALTEIYNRYWDKLLSVASNRLASDHEAEECVQDVFLSLWRRREELVLTHTLSTYLGAAVKYQVINRLDKRYADKYLQTTELTPEMEHAVQVEAADSSLLEKELLQRLEATVAKLPAKCQMVYRLSREEGRTNKEIAQILVISEKTVEGHLTKAFHDIRNNLSLFAPLILVEEVLREVFQKFH